MCFAVSRSISGVPATTIYGIIGTVRLNSGLHLIVITQVKRVGQIKGQDVFRIVEAQVHKLGRDKGLTSTELADDAVYVKMIKAVLAEDCEDPLLLLIVVCFADRVFFSW